MAKRIAMTKLDATTLDILNTIRANATYEYQSSVPVVEKEEDIPKVGDVLYGYPALANQFINALVNRIALVKVNSATFNNAYADLKKGMLEFGETVEEVFVNITKALKFTPEKGEARELKRYMPDVRSAFHAMNWRVVYPVTIQNEDLRLAFTSFNGVEDLIAKIVGAITTASEYDEFLLFKYLMIKAIAHGKMYPVGIDTSDIKNCAKAFRGTSNKITFMNTKYNSYGVDNNTPKERQYIFMDSDFNASYDVDVLASAFNMDRATFSGKLKLIDEWDTFDNDRFSVIKSESDGIEDITADELALMKDVVGVLIDSEWFQIYDNKAMFTEKYVASGLYWNYFYHVWKTVSSSPFANAVVFVKNTADIALPETVTVEVSGVDTSEVGTIYTLDIDDDTASLVNNNWQFVQTKQATKDGIAIQKYGAVVIPADKTSVKLQIKLNDTIYYAQTAIEVGTTATGTTIEFKSTEV